MTSIQGSIPPSIPFHVARAYGGQRVEAVSNRVVTSEVSPIGKIGSNQENTSEAKANSRRLVAGVVPGRVDFSADAPAPSSSAAMAFYRHPADKNSAATGVRLGRAVDVSG